jgi:hypothetical protein
VISLNGGFLIILLVVLMELVVDQPLVVEDHRALMVALIILFLEFHSHAKQSLPRE